MELAADLANLVPGQFEVALEVQLDWFTLELHGVRDYGCEGPCVEYSRDHGLSGVINNSQ